MEKLVVIPQSELVALLNSCVRTALQEYLPQSQIDSGDILTHSEAASFLHMSEQTLYGYCYRLAVPYFKGGGDPARKKAPNLYSKKELAVWQQNGRQLTVEQIKELNHINISKKSMK